MKKTIITTMPDKSGEFLKACECFYNLNINILRVSYNKSVDTNTMFIEVDGEEENLNKLTLEFERLGYITKIPLDSEIILISFELDDTTGDLVRLLKLVNKYEFNISYISTIETHSGAQRFKMALLVKNAQNFTNFYIEAKCCFNIEVVEYDDSKTLFDNSLFYKTFASNLAKNANLNKEYTEKLAVNVNRIMQYLDERKISPKETFDVIEKFANHINKYKGENFTPKISEYEITKNSKIFLIEPPCGSNTAILKSFDEYLFIDCGYAVYKKEMLKIFNDITGNFKKITKRVVVTHSDLDHSGLLNLFDEILVSDKTKKCYELESQNKRGFREQNPMHLPYVKICKLLSHYAPPPTEKLKVIASSSDEQISPIYKAGELKFNEFNFDVYLGQGGHVSGETILIDKTNKIVFSGDVYVNVKDSTPEQAEYNKYAPILLSSVDMNPYLAKLQRNALLNMLNGENYLVFCGHGSPKRIN